MAALLVDGQDTVKGGGRDTKGTPIIIKTYSSAAEIGGSWAGSVLGAKGGAWAGAAIGTAVLPGVGTAVGGIAGGLVLGVVGSFAESSLGKWVIDITEIGE